MHRRPFGSPGHTVSEIGLGCWQLGGDWGTVSEERAQAILDEAADQGVTFYDTADVYGDGRSERLIGRFLRRRPERLFVATKVGRTGAIYPDGYSEALVRSHVDASRRRLGVDNLDLVQLQCIPTAVLRRGAVFDWLRRLQADGAIRHFGASVESMAEALLCLEQPGLVSLQIIFNIFRQKPITTLFDQAQARSVALIVRLPLASGLLSGKFSRDTTFPEDDHRHYNRDGAAFNVGETFAGLTFRHGVAMAEQIKPLVPPGMTMAQMAQRWVLDHPAVTTVITGASQPGQVAENARASALPPLDGELHQALARLYHEQIHASIRGPY